MELVCGNHTEASSSLQLAVQSIARLRDCFSGDVVSPMSGVSEKIGKLILKIENITISWRVKAVRSTQLSRQLGPEKTATWFITLTTQQSPPFCWRIFNTDLTSPQAEKPRVSSLFPRFFLASCWRLLMRDGIGWYRYTLSTTTEEPKCFSEGQVLSCRGGMNFETI